MIYADLLLRPCCRTSFEFFSYEGRSEQCLIIVKWDTSQKLNLVVVLNLNLRFSYLTWNWIKKAENQAMLTFPCEPDSLLPFVFLLKHGSISCISCNVYNYISWGKTLIQNGNPNFTIRIATYFKWKAKSKSFLVPQCMVKSYI